jgi:tripartite-type tricarboxylate transporter receptor subunit TctC
VPYLRFLLLALLLAFAGQGGAQSINDKPIRLVVGYAAGGGADILARLLATKLQDVLGQNVVVENRPGAGGTMAATVVARSAADGLTLYFSDASFVTAPAVYAKLPYDTTSSFAPVANVASLPLAFSVNPAVPATTPAELIALLQANPERFTYGTPGVGTLHHLTSELLKKQTGIRMTHVPYRGAAPALGDLMGGQIQIAVTSATAVLSQAGGGKIRVIGLTSRQRLASAPNIATLAEAIPGFAVTNDLFVLAAAGTPDAVISRLAAALRTVLAQKTVQDEYLAQGAIVDWTSPLELGSRITRDITRWRTVAKEAGIVPE